MKSNLNELFKSKFPDYKDNGVFNINDLVEDVMSEFSFSDKVSKKELEKYYVKSRIESMVNNMNCFSYDKDNFVNLDHANLNELFSIDEKCMKDIQGHEKTHKKIRNAIRIREKERIDGQMMLNLKAAGDDELFIEEQPIAMALMMPSVSMKVGDAT